MSELSRELEEYAANRTFDLRPEIEALEHRFPDRLLQHFEAVRNLKRRHADPKIVHDAEEALYELETDFDGAFSIECAAEALSRINADLEMQVSVTESGLYMHREHMLLDPQLFPHLMLEDVNGTRSLVLDVIAEEASKLAVQNRCGNMSVRERDNLRRLLRERMFNRLKLEAFSEEPLPDRDDDEIA